MHRLIKITKTVENNFHNEYNLHGSIISLRKFFLNDFCDFYIEYAKFYQKNFNNDKQELIGDLLKVTMNSILLMYHPFIPCLTEELYKENDQMKFESILNLPYPNFDKYSKLQVSYHFINSIAVLLVFQTKIHLAH
jgi:valyl-tRNA synthetase